MPPPKNALSQCNISGELQEAFQFLRKGEEGTFPLVFHARILMQTRREVKGLIYKEKGSRLGGFSLAIFWILHEFPFSPHNSPMFL